MPSKEEILEEAGKQILMEISIRASELGASFDAGAEDVARFISAKAAELSLAVDQPGFNEAVIAARDSVLLKAAGRAVVEADRWDETLKETARSSLSIVARLIPMLG
jgi:hypothetical protein